MASGATSQPSWCLGYRFQANAKSSIYFIAKAKTVAISHQRRSTPSRTLRGAAADPERAGNDSEGGAETEQCEIQVDGAQLANSSILRYFYGLSVSSLKKITTS